MLSFQNRQVVAHTEFVGSVWWPGQFLPPASRALVASAAAVFGVGCVILFLTDLGPLSAPMALHIALMSALAPLCAYALHAGWSNRAPPTTGIWPSTLMQVSVLWVWHMPVTQQWVISSGAVAAVMHAMLFAVALWFWSSVNCANPWKAIFALLFTGKLVCLLGAILIFAPRVLCSSSTQMLTLSDQQLAGLLMVTGCSLSYLVAAVVLAAQAVRPPGRDKRVGLPTPA